MCYKEAYNMSYTLDAFHFSAEKSAKILRQYCKERNVSHSTLAKCTGCSYDTIGNVLSGKIQDLTFERVFKICVVLGVPVEAYMLLMLKDEDITFADDVLLYDPEHGGELHVQGTALPVGGIIPDSVAAVATPGLHDQRTMIPLDVEMYSRDELQAVLDRVTRCHEHHMADMRNHAEMQHEIICKLINKE